MKQWLAFLRNNREAIAAMDFFTVPTLTINNMDSLYWAADEKGLSLSSGIVGSREILYVDLKGDAKPCGNVVATDVLETSSPDGRHFSINNWKASTNMWLMENF